MSDDRYALACSSGTLDMRCERDGRVRLQVTDWFSNTAFALLSDVELLHVIKMLTALSEVVVDA